MKRSIYILFALLGLFVVLSSCTKKSEMIFWDGVSMTMKNGETVELPSPILYNECYESHWGDTICSLTRFYRGEDFDTYYVRKDSKLYECSLYPYKYIITKDKLTGKMNKKKNPAWDLPLSYSKVPSYECKQDGDFFKLIQDGGVIFTFKRSPLRVVE